MAADKISIVQHNAGRGAIVSDQLLHYCIQNGIDVLMIQEPYTRNGRLVGLDTTPLRCQVCPGTTRAGNNVTVHGAAIVVINPRIKALARDDLCKENVSVVSLDNGESGQLTLITAYFKYRVATHSCPSAYSR